MSSLLTVLKNSVILSIYVGVYLRTDQFQEVGKLRVNKITVAIVVLVAVCIASFVGVRQLTKSQQIDNPVINVGETQSSAPIAPDTSESAQPQPSESESAQPSSDTQFTTFDLNAISSTAAPSTTKPTTTSTSSTTASTTTTAQSTTASTTTDKYIEEATKTSKGFMGYLFNDDGNFYYTDADPWQRQFGFNKAYDFGAQFVFMYYDTARIYFDYQGKNWMVQMWKGQYGGVFIGAEIGVYNKPTDRDIEHYDCANNDEALYMDMTLYRNGDELLSREYAKYWWCTGFVPGKLKKYSDRSELEIKTRITMKDKAMRKAFVKGLENCAEYTFVEGENFTVDGLDVFINW